MTKLRGIELKCAQLVPSAMFASPKAVVRMRGLSIPQKIAILRRWEFDMRRGGGAQAGGGESEIRLLEEEVHGALAILGVAATVRTARRSGPARH